MVRLIDVDKKIIVPITDETKGGMVYEAEMTVAELFSKFIPDYQPEIVNAIPVEWLKRQHLQYMQCNDRLMCDAYAVVLGEWIGQQKEQEAKREPEVQA